MSTDELYVFKEATVCETPKARKIAKTREGVVRGKFESLRAWMVSVEVHPTNDSMSKVALRFIGTPKDPDEEGMTRMVRKSALISPDGNALPAN